MERALVQWKKLATLVIVVLVLLAASLTAIAWHRAYHPLTPSQILIPGTVRNPK